ncbi:PP2C family protein-serine/threonine phosphatase [Actinomadura opuntiae]|uniref:PP2C family protein-serine/threonine phosphatase n=1 Tax=Actinomadura sp. OS1-43 TaxID=604315 RepID=UPI00255A9B7F|nr:PP2C family protein-serine/threonine phosphatase [Actinomadura sp. OS1-43]MDL4819347.1 PP2C family protein-serine/threonine phosphatase [Actinomadura sp. OS1-43]
MSTHGRAARVERALRLAPAHALPETLTALFRQELPQIREVRLLVNDYHSRVLLPVEPFRAAPGRPAGGEPAGGAAGGAAGGEPAAPIRIRGTAPGRAFVSRRRVVDSAVVFVPVTARGERLGVLEFRSSAAGWDDAVLDALEETGAVFGAALRVAWKYTDRYERARRDQRLTLAAELQWQLLPGHACSGDGYSLAGHLEPAYSIGGDNFDWSAEHDHLALTVTNGSGTGIQAALLTSLTVGALRNARRSGADIGEQASLANDMVHVRYGGREFTETLVMRIDLADGTVHVIDAGSPRILRARGAEVTPVPLEQQLPLGMFPDTEYRPQRFHLEPGDRLVIVSDGVFSARSARGEFGTHALEQATRRSRLQDAAEVPLTIVNELIEHHEGADLADDAVVVCLDWHRPAAPAAGEPE